MRIPNFKYIIIELYIFWINLYSVLKYIFKNIILLIFLSFCNNKKMFGYIYTLIDKMYDHPYLSFIIGFIVIYFIKSKYGGPVC
jgi:hypothetical protein